MNEYVFPTEFHYETPKGEMNFLGAVKRYFVIINKLNNDNTNYEYFRTYRNIIFPLVNPGTAINNYDNEMIDNLIEELKSQRNLLSSTIKSDYRHLIVDPFKEYQKEFGSTKYDAVGWGNEYSFHSEGEESKDAIIMLIPKSFTPEEDLKAKKYFLSCSEANGEVFGLAIMYFIGSRENEICGLKFSDFREFERHPGCYYIISGYETTGKNSNELEAGGKTQNSSKKVPLPDEVTKLIQKRIVYIEKQTGKSCLDLPMACKEQKLDVRCSTNDLSVAGRKFFKEVMKMRENDMAGIAIEMKELVDTPFEEKEPTTYFLRRNFATRIGNLIDKENGLSLADCQYLLSHQIEGLKFDRSDYNDEEKLFSIHKILNTKI